jgi:SAM-dependent methyltransferase
MNVQPQSGASPVPSGCELCGETAARELYIAKDRLRNSQSLFLVVECSGCRVLRTLPEMTDRELQIFYPDQYWGEENKPDERWIVSSQADKTRFLYSCILTGSRILDVGCGAGFFLRALGADRWDRFGVEIGEAASKAAARSIGHERIFTGTLMEAACADSFFDVVTFWSSLEHTNEPRAHLIEARRILKLGGTLIVQLPNAASYQMRLFKGDWFALDVPRHRYHFTAETLSRLLNETGFEVYRTTLFSKAHNAHALRQSLKRKLVSGGAQGVKYALFCLTIPFIKPFDWVMTCLGSGATLTVAARAV